MQPRSAFGRVLATLAALFTANSALGADAVPRPNVLLISLDTVRADFLTFREPDATPRLTALAGRGTVFDQAISGTSWTLPSHAQMFTGMSPPYHGTESKDVGLDSQIPILPELLDRAGYFTASIFSVQFLWGDYGFDRGFDYFHSAILEEKLDEPQRRLAPRGEEAKRDSALLTSRDQVFAPNVVYLARRALERALPDQPVFLFAHFYDPHIDYTPPAPFDRKFDPDYDGDFSRRQLLSNPAFFDPSKNPTRVINDRDLEYIRNQYKGEIAWTDHWVGKLLDLLNEFGRLDDTLIVVVSDHGEEFFEHGNPNHRKSLFDESIRVPLLIVPPRASAAGSVRSVSSQVTLSDLLPTILDWLDLPIPASVDGRSLKPSIYGAALASRTELLSLYSSKSTERGEARDHVQIYGLRSPEFKFARYTLVPAVGKPEVRAFYYDLTTDPAEQRPIIEFADERLRRAWRTLEEELDEVRDYYRTAPLSERAERSKYKPEIPLAELRALGYVEDADVDSTGSAVLLKPWGLEPLPRVDLPPLEGPVRISRRAALAVAAGVTAALVACGVFLISRRRRA
jgi:arylsulfatase A-like enzyme